MKLDPGIHIIIHSVLSLKPGVTHVRSDNGSEFRNTNVEEFLDEEGIKHEFSAPYTPQQNGIVERKNRTLIEAARTMLDEYKTRIAFGPKQSTPLAWQSTVSTSTSTWARLHMR